MSSKRPAAWFETYGCQMNKNDSELVAGILAEHGYTVTRDLDHADIALINTCSVRAHAEQRALGRIHNLAHWKQCAPGRKIVVLGCMAQKDRESLFDEIPAVDLIAGPDAYRHLPGLLKDPGRACDTQPDSTETYSGIHPLRAPHVSGWVTIMRGCDNFCSYCIVPYTRGRERSRPFREIEKEIVQMTSLGFREVTLLGQNVNSYHDGESDFPGLLEKIAANPDLKRIRFMTSHPKDCSERLFEVMGSNGIICPHLHLPVQSGSNRILERMNRGYTREHYLQLIDLARTSIPELAVTTDMMVGFPGESESDFGDTVSLMRTVRFDDAFMYHYSPRPGTASAKMADDVPQEEKLVRLNHIIQIQHMISREIKSGMIGSIRQVMAEETSKQSGSEWLGKTGGNHAVVFPKQHIGPGEIVSIRIESCRGFTLRGTALAAPGHESSSGRIRHQDIPVRQSTPI
ncbi:tRNA (N6-isopentenyl adenosine(37)-C2)-methylthiotransferase MiaB [bacterium]|nr:tRNA (N6-isopentenyl adenosine(37)-C2)-methylthiotransferase MiaB [bacterium]